MTTGRLQDGKLATARRSLIEAPRLTVLLLAFRDKSLVGKQKQASKGARLINLVFFQLCVATKGPLTAFRRQSIYHFYILIKVNIFFSFTND